MGTAESLRLEGKDWFREPEAAERVRDEALRLLAEAEHDKSRADAAEAQLASANKEITTLDKQPAEAMAAVSTYAQ